MILHTEGSDASIKEQEMLESTLTRFQHNFQELLNYMQYNLVDYTDYQKCIGAWIRREKW